MASDLDSPAILVFQPALATPDDIQFLFTNECVQFLLFIAWASHVGIKSVK